MNEVQTTDTKFAMRFLSSVSGPQLLFALWIAIVASELPRVLHMPGSAITNEIGELVLGIVWFGYPILVFRCFTESRMGTAVIAALIVGLLLAAILTRFTADQTADSPWVSVVTAAFVVSLFAAGAYGLRRGEKKGLVRYSHTNALVAISSFIVLPLLGSFIHARVRRALNVQAN